jgi:hypothetical protein
MPLTDEQKLSIARKDLRYAELWGIPLEKLIPPSPVSSPQPVPKTARNLPCVALREATGELVQCPTCSGTVNLKVYSCEIHGSCTLGKKVEKYPCCVQCPDYAPLSLPQPQQASNSNNAPSMTQDQQSTPQPESTSVHLGKPLKWAYGVTTVPSRLNTLFPVTLESLRLAGFEKPTIFVDNCNNKSFYQVYEQAGYNVVTRWPRAYTPQHWLLSAWEIFLRNPDADRYAIFQDDLVMSKGVRRYLDSVPYPDNPKGYLNLYTFRGNEDMIRGKKRGFHLGLPLNSQGAQRYHGRMQQKGLGAVALVFSREVFMMLLSSNHMVNRFRDVTRRNVFIDGAIAEAMNQLNCWEYVHSPSLVQHTGLDSTMGHSGQQQARSFAGEEFDATSLLLPARQQLPAVVKG